MVKLPAEEAQKVLQHWLNGTKPGYAAITLFGDKATENWTVALLSDLKEMATALRVGRLTQVLQSAMPLRDDFSLYLNGDPIVPRKLLGNKIGPWTLGKEIAKLGKPAPEDLQVSIDGSLSEDDPLHFGLVHPKLGRLTGYAEVYDSLLTTGGSSSGEYRSHGFFVYVRGRLVNIEDEYFGIDRNLLRHGTFSRFRMVVNVDRLDEELRSSRETVREGELLLLTRKTLQAVFNFARQESEEHDAQGRESDSYY